MANFFITGITGFVGSHMADYILDKHNDIYVFGFKRWRSDMSNVKHLLNHPRVEFVDGDLLDITSVRRALNSTQPDCIYHFAAQSLPETSFYTPGATLTTNIVGTSNLFDTVIGCDLDPIIISVSSSEVYGNPEIHEIPIKETNPIRAANPYSISKVGHDLMSQYYYKAYGLKIITTRMFSHEGKRRGKMFALSSFANQIVQHENSEDFPNKGPYEIRVGNLDSVRTYNHIDDAIEAYWLCSTQGQIGEVYNIGGDHTLTIKEALEKLLFYSKGDRNVWDIVVDERRVRPTDITLQVPDSSKFREATGWKPTKNIDAICKDMLDYWREDV